MWSVDLPLTRTIIKQRMIERRGGEICDLCGGPGWHMHEIVSRYRSMSNEQARQQSFSEEICSLLCETCHTNIAPTIDGRKLLLEFNCRLYGRDAVRTVLEQIPTQFRRDVRLPDGNATA